MRQRLSALREHKRRAYEQYVALADSGHLERAAATAGGQEAFDAATTAMPDDARGWRLAEMRTRRGMTQEQVAIQMGVSVARASQIESTTFPLRTS